VPKAVTHSADCDSELGCSTSGSCNELFPGGSTSLSSWAARVTLERMYMLSQESNLQHCIGEQLDSNAFAVTTEDKQTTPQRNRNQERSPDYFAQVGDAIRTLREDIPSLFDKELNYSIYREDIVFKDPRNKFDGMKNYKLIFWSLRFHGKIFFSNLYVEVKRIWQPQDDVIKMRWTVHGIPRVPWEAEGLFDGISTYKLDSKGKVYEHSVDNVLLRDPPMLTNPPLLAGLNLVPGGPQQPVAGSWYVGEPSDHPVFSHAAQSLAADSTLPTTSAPAAPAASGSTAATATGAWLRGRGTVRQPIIYTGPAFIAQPLLKVHHAAEGAQQAVLPAEPQQPCTPAHSSSSTTSAATSAASSTQDWVGRFSWVRLYATLLGSQAIGQALWRVVGAEDGGGAHPGAPLAA